MPFFRAVVVGFSLAALLSACGGGGSSPAALPAQGSGTAPPGPPVITASVMVFGIGASTSTPYELMTRQRNALATVQVRDAISGAAIANAAVKVNGVTLTWVAADAAYRGEVQVYAGDAVSLSVNAHSQDYSASGSTAYMQPVLRSPQGLAWDTSRKNVLAWSGALATGDTFATAIVDPSGSKLVWPGPHAFRLIAPAAGTSHVFAANELAGLPASSKPYYVAAGTAREIAIPGAAASSRMTIGKFIPAEIYMGAGPAGTPTAVRITRRYNAVGQSGKVQLSATASYAGQRDVDVTGSVTWSSSDAQVASIDQNGLAQGIGTGSTQVSATLGAVSGTADLTVFQPVPSIAPAVSQAVSYQGGPTHAGVAAFGQPLVYPASPTWSVPFSGQISYPLIAGGKAFVIALDESVPVPTKALYALDLQSGALAWGPVALGGALPMAGLAYDHGKVFVLTDDATLRAFDAQSGAQDWSLALPGAPQTRAALTAAHGMLFLEADNGLPELYALDQAQGRILWTAQVPGIGTGLPTVAPDGDVYVSYSTAHAFRLSRYTGEAYWHAQSSSTGGSSLTNVYAQGMLYSDRRADAFGDSSQRIFALTGEPAELYTASATPAVAGQMAYILHDGVLSARDRATRTTAWTFDGNDDDPLVSAPLLVEGAVIIASASGRVFALHVASGAQLWNALAGGPVTAYDVAGTGLRSGLAAGEGYLLVPAGSTLTAWRLVP